MDVKRNLLHSWKDILVIGIRWLGGRGLHTWQIEAGL